MAKGVLIWGLLIAVLIAATLCTQAKSFNRYQVLNIGPVTNSAQFTYVQSLQNQCDDVKVIMMDAYMINVMKRPVLLAFGPRQVKGVKAQLRSRRIRFKVVTRNLQTELDAEKKANDAAVRKAVPPLFRGRNSKRMSTPMRCLLRLARGTNWHVWAKHIMSDPNWRKYICSGIPRPLRVIPQLPNYYCNTVQLVAWVEEVGRRSQIAKAYSIGKTYEGRDTMAIKINEDRRNLPIIWVDAGMHAREWLSVSTALYVIHRILFGNDQDAVYLRENFRWYIVPNTNPDGYAFSHTHVRMWRKNRSPSSDKCIGTDLNRNFDFDWGHYGASKKPCSNLFRGNSSFSEVESRNLRDAILPISQDIKLLLTMHTYDQSWLLPYLGQDQKPADYDELQALSEKAVASLEKVHGRKFRIGRLIEFYGFKLTGTQLDWAKQTANIKYSFSPELRPATKKEGGFKAPKSFIIPSGEELFAALVTCCRNI